MHHFPFLGLRLARADLENPKRFARAIPLILERSGLRSTHTRLAWNRRAHALRVGKDPVSLFCWLMKNPNRWIPEGDQDAGGQSMKTQDAESGKSKEREISYKSYQDFLKSWEWRWIRKCKLRQEKYTCQRCDTRRCRKDLEIHHLNYDKPWGRETRSDLAVLCSPCHRREHGYPESGNIAELVDWILEHGYGQTVDSTRTD